MASTQALSAASQDRKARLAQLKSLKRKLPNEHEDEAQPNAAKSPRYDGPSHADDDAEEATPEDSVTAKYLSGRNYDPVTKGAKLGFESTPAATHPTLESQAAALAVDTKRQAEEEEKADKPLDLFKLQPKKPNWDLKRDLERKLEVLDVRTNNAIAKIVRERIASQQKAAKERNGGVNGDAEGGEAVGIEGVTLVEATNVRERQDEEEARREREEEEALLDGT
jgi:coiled-coil domain-containing protein 12